MAVTTLSDFLNAGIPACGIWDGSWEAVAWNVEAAESVILSALRTAGYDVPIPETSWTPELRLNACIYAGYHYLRVRGWTATDGADAEFVFAYKSVLEWLTRVRESKEHPLPKNQNGNTEDATPESEPHAIAIETSKLRGW